MKFYNNYDSVKSQLVEEKTTSFFKKKNIYGLNDSQGNKLLPIEYDAIYPLENNNTRRFTRNGESGIMDENFNTIFKFEGKWISEEDDLGQRRFSNKKGEIGIFDKNFDVLCEPIKKSIWIGPLEENETRRIILRKSPSFGAYMLAYSIDFASFGMASRYARNKDFASTVNLASEINKESKELAEEEIIDGFNNLHDLEKIEYHDEGVNLFILFMLKSQNSDDYIVYGLLDKNHRFVIEPEYNFITPVMDDNTRICFMKKKSYIYDILSNSVTLKGK
jgi:hypothetical protein